MTSSALSPSGGGPPLRALLPGVLVCGLLVAACATEVLWGWRHAEAVANATCDGPLHHALLAIDASLRSHNNDPAAPALQTLLAGLRTDSGARLQVRLVPEPAQAGTAGMAAGSGAWPLAEALRDRGQVHFQDVPAAGQVLRVGSLASGSVGTPSASAIRPASSWVIQVAQDSTARDALARQLMRLAVLRDLGLAALAGLLAFATLAWGLRPLRRLGVNLASRSPDDLTPLPTEALPSDLQVLIEGMNRHLARVQGAIQLRRRFMDDTAHQLRAPLTVLQTQVSCALREPDPVVLRKTLDAIHSHIDDTVRQTQQMLALARSDDADFVLLPTDVHAVAAACARDWWRTARAHGITLSFDAEHAPPMLVRGHAGLIKEALANLLHNAVRHTTAGGHITVGLHWGDEGRTACLRVTDDGMGVPAAELPHLGQRYFRASNSQGTGSGLGLAIVHNIVARHGGEVQVDAGPQGQGLAVTLCLPAAPPAAV